MTEPNRSIADVLRQRRHQLGLSQSDLAARLGWAQTNISRIEKGKQIPSWTTLSDLARALELEPMLIPREKIRAVKATLDYDPSRGDDAEDALIPDANG